MTEDLTELLRVGYCYSLRNAGRFTIGEDFEAPRPVAGKLPRIGLDRTKWDQLWSLVPSETDIDRHENLDAELFDETMKRIDFENGVIEAMNWYVSDCWFQTELPTFRKQLKDLRKAVERLKSVIPDENSSLDHFLHTTFTGEVFLRDQQKPSTHQLTALQERWRRRQGFIAIQETLNTTLCNIEAAQSLLIGSRRSTHQVKVFVHSLAQVWKKATGKWPTSGRDGITNRQSGRFADFVRETNENLPRNYRIVTLDAAIRAACAAANRP
jgi:hypothetical protein